MQVPSNNKISSFGILNQAEQEILKSENETKEVYKSSIETNKSFLEQKRQERIDNLEERLRLLAKNNGGGCLKFLKVISIVVAAVTAPLSGGLLSLPLAKAVSLVLNAISSVVEGLEKLKAAMHQKEILLNQAGGQDLLRLIQETSEWIDDEKKFLDESNIREKESLEAYRQSLRDLEKSFESMIRV